MIWIIVGTIVVTIVGAVVYGIHEGREWTRFAAAHDCRVVAREGASVGVGPNGSGGVATVIIPGKTAYACNDGVTYWR